MQWQCLTFDQLTTTQLYAVMRLRQAVFVVEQDCAYLDADDQDQGATHLLGVREGRLLAYLRIFAPGRVYPEAAIGRVVVDPSVRGAGLGRTIMLEGIRTASEAYPDVGIKLSAQAHLQHFYESLGFSVCGEGYLEDGIPHLPMRRPTRSS